MGDKEDPFKDIQGEKFGMLTVISREPNNKWYRPVWKCLCDCGLTCTRVGTSFKQAIKNDRINNCGCIANRCRIKPDSIINLLYGQYRISAKRRNLSLSLSKEEFEALLKSSCYYCNKDPENKVYAIYKRKGIRSKDKSTYETVNGIDRLDNTLGYSVENSVSCCFVCNSMKSNIEKEIFLKQISKIYNNLQCERSLIVSKSKLMSTYKSFRDITLDSNIGINRRWNNYISSARKRNLEFNLTLKIFTSLLKSNCQYCGDMPYNKVYGYNRKGKIGDRFQFLNGVDRMNNEEGYTLENSVSCCFLCNRMKRDFNLDDFLNKIKEIKEHHLTNLPSDVIMYNNKIGTYTFLREKL